MDPFTASWPSVLAGLGLIAVIAVAVQPPSRMKTLLVRSAIVILVAIVVVVAIGIWAVLNLGRRPR